MSIDILIPTYRRAARIPAIVENVRKTTHHDHDIWFCVEADDHHSVHAAAEAGAGVVINERAQSYSGAINTGYFKTSAEYLFAGADDLRFVQGWDVPLIEMLSNDPWVAVVGTMDSLNPYVNAGSHATHYMVRRSYLDNVGGIVDLGPGSFLFEGYVHNYTDTEFIGTAKMRARFRPCFTSHVPHQHWSKGLSPVDSITDRANAALQQDFDLYNSRRDLWFNISR